MEGQSYFSTAIPRKRKPRSQEARKRITKLTQKEIDNSQDYWELASHAIIVLITALTFVFLIYGFFLNTLNAVREGNELRRLDNIVSQYEERLNLYENVSNKGSPDGYAPLNGTGIIPTEFFTGFLEGLFLFSGCWDANTNDPILISGSGINGQQYSVCTAGSTLLDGIADWAPFDLPTFLNDLSAWILFEGRRNTMEDTVTPGAGENSIIVDGLGPVFRLKEFEAVGNRTTITDNGDTLDLNVDGQPEETTLSDASLSGTSIITDGTGPTLSIRKLEDSSTVLVNNLGTEIQLAAVPGNIIPALGTITIPASSSPGGVTPTPIRFQYEIFGQGYLFYSQPSIDLVFPDLASMRTSQLEITLFLNLASDLSIALIAASPKLTGGQLIGISGAAEGDPRGLITGSCRNGGIAEILCHAQATSASTLGGNLNVREFETYIAFWFRLQ